MSVNVSLFELRATAMRTESAESCARERNILLGALELNGSEALSVAELGAGHGGPSGRYDAWRDEAFVYAFILDALGLTGASSSS